MKIVQIINALTWGGAQILVLDLSRHLQDMGHHVLTISFRDGPVGNLLRERNIPTACLPENFFDLQAFQRLRSILEEFRPDVIHTHLFRATFWARMAAAGPKKHLITSVHGIESPYYQRLEKRMASLSSYIIFPSTFLLKWYEQEIRPIPDHRKRVIPPGAPIFTPQKSNQTRKIFHIGSLSRLHPVKGLDVLLKACSKLCAWNLDFRLFIGGEGKEKEKLEALAKTYGIHDKVSFTGEVLTVSNFLENLDIFVAPSQQEAFGLTVCEAMERSLPVVASNVGGIREIISSTDHGCLFQAGNSDDLAEKLLLFFNNSGDRERIGSKAREKIVSHLRRDDWINKHLEIYEKFGQKHVHVAISSNELGGGERMAISIARSLKKRGWRISTTCGGDPLAAECKANGIPTSSVSMRAGGFFFAAKLWLTLKSKPFFALHAHLNRAALISGLFRTWLKIPVLSHVHGLNRAAYYRNSDRLLAVSRAVEQHLLQQGVPRGKITMLPNAIDKQSRFVERKPGPPWILAIIAKLHKNKGHSWALKALEKNLADLPEFQIWIFGDGPEKSHLRSQEGPLQKQIFFFGFQKDLDRFFPQIHVVLLPSLGEGIPLSLLEAMRWGIPAVASNVGGIPEIIFPNQNGLLVTPEDAEELVKALKLLLQPQRWARFSKQSMELFEQINSFSSLTKKIEEVLIEIGEK